MVQLFSKAALITYRHLRKDLQIWEGSGQGLFKGINVAIPGQQDRHHHEKNNPFEIRITTV
jgi:hypothetical protein